MTNWVNEHKKDLAIANAYSQVWGPGFELRVLFCKTKIVNIIKNIDIVKSTNIKKKNFMIILLLTSSKKIVRVDDTF